MLGNKHSPYVAMCSKSVNSHLRRGISHCGMSTSTFVQAGLLFVGLEYPGKVVEFEQERNNGNLKLLFSLHLVIDIRIFLKMDALAKTVLRRGALVT